MVSDSNHEHFMNLALKEAERYLSSTAPNPMVGACLVHNNRLVSCRAHERYGSAHAEVNAITSAQSTNEGSAMTLYVTLEPCAHFGKTPPCTDFIIESGIRTVVVACRDPNPLVAGKGITRLRASGVTVIENICHDEARFLNRRFFTRHEKHRPYLILKWAETCNHFIAPPSGRITISCAESHSLSHRWRAEESAIMVGGRTALIDNPSLTCRLHEGTNPLRIVLDTHGTLPSDRNLWNGEATTLCFTVRDRRPWGNEEVIVLNHETAPLKQVVTILAERAINSVIIEGGAALHNSFVEQDLWDELRIFQAPQEIESGVHAIEQAPLLSQCLSVTHESIGVDTLVTGYRAW
jgi:diaminohydroxyphosphoribosylaminopyrimidine deaminase/5-amino-6-(5-phosphoribosylamino)uracil reductase